MNKTVKGLLLAFVLTLALSISNTLLAQGPPGGGGPGSGGGCIPPPCVPIDGGLSFLVLAGAAFGAKKLYDGTRP